MVPKLPEEGKQELNGLGKQGPGLVRTKAVCTSICEKPLSQRQHKGILSAQEKLMPFCKLKPVLDLRMLMVGSMDHRKPAVLASKSPQTMAKRTTMLRALNQGPPYRWLYPVYFVSHIGALVTHLLCRGGQRAPELR